MTSYGVQERRAVSFFGRLAQVFLFFAANIKLRMSNVIVPTIDALGVLQQAMTTTPSPVTSKDLSGTALTYVEYYRVPDGEEWELLFIIIEATVANTLLLFSPTPGTSFTLSDLGIAQRIEDHVKGMTLYPGQAIGLAATGNAADTDIWMRPYYKKKFTLS